MLLQKDSEGRSVVPIVINNEILPLDAADTAPVINSSTDETVHYFHAADASICEKACDAAWTAFQKWKREKVSTRRDLIFKAAGLIAERAAEFIRVQKLETSCNDPWAQNNVNTTIGYLKEIASCISGIKGTIPPTDKPDTMTFVYKDPVGPILVIPPWNAAMILAARAITSAIAAGCTVVVKASELSPLTHAMLAEVFRDAGFPPGVLNILQARREDAARVTETLIAHPGIRKIDFIGSAAVGRLIGATASKYLKPVLMELGGKCPAIVLDNANLPKAAAMIARGVVMHHGQICFGTERVIVLKKIADEFIKLLSEQIQQSSGGTAVNKRIAQNAFNILRDAKNKGAKFLVGGVEMAGENSVAPALVQIDPKTKVEAMKIVDEESFSPSASVYVVEDDEEAIAIANRSSYGLNAAIHTRNLERAIKMGRELEYGQIHTNCPTVYTSPTGPQGGVKGSGWGRQNASWGLEEFLVERHISWHGENAW